MNFFSSPPISLLRGRGCVQPIDPRVIMSVMETSVGQDASSSPFDVISLSKGRGYAAIYSEKTTKLPVWAYARMFRDSTPFEIWMYLARPGIPIYSVSQGRWTSVSKYDTQTATPDDSTIIATVDVSKGAVLRSGESIYASDALGVSEVQMTIIDEDEDDKFGSRFVPVINIKAAKGLARTDFTPYAIDRSLSGSSLGLTAAESKGLPLPPPAPVVSTPPVTTSTAPSSPPWLAIGAVTAVAVAMVVSLGDTLATSARNQP